MLVAFPCPFAQAKIRAAAGVNKATENIATEEVREESNVETYGSEVSVGPAKFALVVAGNTHNTIPKGWRRPLQRSGKILQEGSTSEGQLRAGVEPLAGSTSSSKQIKRPCSLQKICCCAIPCYGRQTLQHPLNLSLAKTVTTNTKQDNEEDKGGGGYGKAMGILPL